MGATEGAREAHDQRRDSDTRPQSAFDAPVAGWVDAYGADAARRWPSQVWSPVAVAVLGFACLAVSLVVVGEWVTRGPFLAGFRGWDQGVSHWFSVRRTSGWSSLSGFGSHMAETVPIIVGALVLEAVLVWRRRWRDLLLVLIGLSVEITVFLSVNEIVRRPRPPVHRLGIEPSTFSFPSGHVAATVVLYGSIALLVSLTYRKRLVTAALWSLVVLLALLVGFARVYRGMHHVSDVVAGALVGLGCLGVAAMAARASSLAATPSRIDAEPAPPPRPGVDGIGSVASSPADGPTVMARNATGPESATASAGGKR